MQVQQDLSRIGGRSCHEVSTHLVVRPLMEEAWSEWLCNRSELQSSFARYVLAMNGDMLPLSSDPLPRVKTGMRHVALSTSYSPNGGSPAGWALVAIYFEGTSANSAPSLPPKRFPSLQARYHGGSSNLCSSQLGNSLATDRFWLPGVCLKLKRNPGRRRAPATSVLSTRCLTSRESSSLMLLSNTWDPRRELN